MYFTDAEISKGTGNLNKLPRILHMKLFLREGTIISN